MSGQHHKQVHTGKFYYPVQHALVFCCCLICSGCLREGKKPESQRNRQEKQIQQGWGGGSGFQR